MPKAGDLKASPPLICHMGPSGSGKTSVWLTLGDAVEVWDFDGNIRSGLFCGDGLDAQRAEANVESFVESDPTSKATGFDKLKKKLTEARKKGGDYHAKVIVMDSLTSLCDSAMLWAQQASGHLGQQPTTQEWGVMAREVESVVNALKVLPFATVLIAHDDIVNVKGENEIRLGVPGQKIKSTLPPKLTDWWYQRTRQGAGDVTKFEILTCPQKGLDLYASGPIPGVIDASKGIEWVLNEMGFPPRPEDETKKGSATHESGEAPRASK